MNLASRIAGTVVHRPYVFVFFAIYLVAAVTRLGARRAALFTGLAYVVAFAAEFSSTRNGFPFGLYHYIDVTRDRELWISNVPFWDTLSFTFLCYLGWRLGVLLYAPLLVREGDLQVVETRALAASWRVCVSGALVTTLLDIVIDPLTVLGDRWFLGRVYYYPAGGIYFGVPLSNFAGWFLVAATSIRSYQLIEWRPFWQRGGRGIRHVPYAGLLEPMLYLGILLFNMTLTFAIGEPLLAAVGLSLYVPVVSVFLARARRSERRATPSDVDAHLRDFPLSPIIAPPGPLQRARLASTP